MPNTCGYAWENLRTEPGTICVHSSTICAIDASRTHDMWTNGFFLPPILTSKITRLSTGMYRQMTSVVTVFLHTIHSAYNYHSFFKKGE